MSMMKKKIGMVIVIPVSQMIFHNVSKDLNINLKMVLVIKVNGIII